MPAPGSRPGATLHAQVCDRGLQEDRRRSPRSHALGGHRDVDRMHRVGEIVGAQRAMRESTSGPVVSPSASAMTASRAGSDSSSARRSPVAASAARVLGDDVDHQHFSATGTSARNANSRWPADSRIFGHVDERPNRALRRPQGGVDQGPLPAGAGALEF